MHEAIGMVLMISDVQSLAANITLTARIVLIATNFHYTIILYSNFKTTDICA